MASFLLAGQNPGGWNGLKRKGQSDVSSALRTTEWTRLVEYARNHLNDFCLFQALDGRWHAIGIQGTGTWESEISFFHCSADDLFGPYEIHPSILGNLEQGSTTNDRPQVHAPYVVVREGLYHLFFRRPWGTNMHARTCDLYDWPTKADVVFEEEDARDACIQCFDSLYHWYYVQKYLVDGVTRSCVMLRTSRDLERWSDATPVFVDTSREVRHSRLESPFVFAERGRYWLLVRDRNLENDDQRAPVTVWQSDTPEAFPAGSGPLGLLPNAHAPEVVEHEGRQYLARVSGASHASPGAPDHHGWLEIARLILLD